MAAPIWTLAVGLVCGAWAGAATRAAPTQATTNAGEKRILGGYPDREVAVARAVGVPADQLSAVPVLTAFLVAYPLTALFFSGLGVLDAAFLIWRVISLGVPLVLGALSLIAWKIELARR